MSSSTRLIKPPSVEYNDDILFGARREATKLKEMIKLGNDSECVMYSIGTFVDKQQWNLKNIIGLDKRLKTMMEGVQITHALPLQRYCWPQMHRPTFPFVCISPESTGKTFTHLLYIVSRSITAIPIAKTNEIISATDHMGSFKTDFCAAKTTNTTSGSIVTQPGDEFDQQNFDFDSLGKEHPTPLPSSNAGVVAGDDGSQSTSENTWGLQTEEHYQVNADDFITHPSYIIICSSQQQVEMIGSEIDRLKSAAYGERATLARLKNLPPIVRTINVHQDEEKLALRCNEAEILVTTPGSLIRCLKSDYITFAKCKKVFFDDLDLTLQLHNYNVREIVKYYLILTSQLDESTISDKSVTGSSGRECESCQMYLFSRKWTDLVKQFVSTVFVQKTLIFGSIVEASLYANLRYELEINTDTKSKVAKLSNLANLNSNGVARSEKLAVVCKSNTEAEKVSLALKDIGHKNALFLPEETALSTLKSRPNTYTSRITQEEPIYVMSDGALEYIVSSLNDITHIIHFSLPDEMLVFDQRFRLMYSHIKDLQRKDLITTIFLNPRLNIKQAKDLYDMVSRSSTTLKSTKLELRDLISDNSTTICWRWASTGLCRLEKLSREDRFGSYCPERHSLISNKSQESTNDATVKKIPESRWPTSGQLKITITHLVSPNEFYFWFEAHRNIESTNMQWTKLESTGSEYMKELQKKLDVHKDTPSCSVPLHKLKMGRVYGIYLQQEARVDRIALLEEVKSEQAEQVNGTRKNGVLSRLSRIHYQLEYSKQCQVLKIDYGVVISVYLRNIFELPQSLGSIEAQCHRGFHLGVKPTDSEPNWLYKAKKHFYDQVCVNNLHEITVWLRLNSSNCFWFEHMVVTRRLTNIDGNRYYKSEPHRELCMAKLAERISSELPCLPPSDRLETLSKWHVDQSAAFVQCAFLRLDKDPLDMFVLHIDGNLELTVRQLDFNKQLIRLEDRIAEDYNSSKLEPLSYFAVGVYCIARIPEGVDPTTNELVYTLNRCKIITVMCLLSTIDQESTEASEIKYRVKCLDHGDEFVVNKTDLYHADPDYISQLPFQAIECCKLADLNPVLFENDKSLANRTRELIYDYTRDKNNQLIPLKSRFNGERGIYLYIPVDGEVHMPLISMLEKNNNISLCVNNDPELREPVRFAKERLSDPIRDSAVDALICEILRDMVKQELSAVGVFEIDDECAKLDDDLVNGIEELNLGE